MLTRHRALDVFRVTRLFSNWCVPSRLDMEDDRPRDNRGATPAGGRRALTAQNTSDDVAYRHPRMSLFRRPSSTARPGHDDEFNYKGLETLQSRESSAGSSRQPRHVINMEMQQTDQMPSLVPEQRRTLLFMKDEDSFDPTGFPGSTRASPFLKNVGRKSSIPSQLYLTPLVAMENGTCLIHKVRAELGKLQKSTRRMPRVADFS